MRIRSLHPGVKLDEVVAATGFPLSYQQPIEVTRAPTDAELRLIREALDPSGARRKEIGG
jgi:hypothetical protein